MVEWCTCTVGRGQRGLRAFRRQRHLEAVEASAVRAEEYRMARVHTANVPARYQSASMAHWRQWVADPGKADAIAAAIRCVRDQEARLLLHGPNGCGKTYLCAAVFNALVVPGALWYDTQTLAGDARAGYEGAEEAGGRLTGEELMRQLVEAPLLVLDDLASGSRSHLTAFSIEILERVLRRRNDGRLATLVTTDVDMETLRTRIGMRAYHGLRELCPAVAMGGGIIRNFNS